MKIAIDIREALSQKTGKGYYTYNIVREILKIDKTNQYILYTNSPGNPYSFFKNVEIRMTPEPGWKWHYRTLQDIKKEKPDLFFSPTSYIIPALAPKSLSVIITVHDLVAFFYPLTHSTKAVIVERLALPLAIKKARHIFTVSENTQKDIIKRFHCRKNKIQVVPCGLSPFYTNPVSPLELEKVGEKFLLPKNFILAVGTLEPRKNLNTLIKSFVIVKRKLPGFKLVIIGKQGWNYKSIEKNIQHLKLKDDILFLGYLEESDLQKVYKLATVFVFPSLYEGFGIPPLEAMACGCPVVSSNTSSMPEVIGDAGILIDPKNAFKLANALIDLIENDQVRNMFIERGRERIKKFNWEESAHTVLKTFKAICQSHDSHRTV